MGAYSPGPRSCGRSFGGDGGGSDSGCGPDGIQDLRQIRRQALKEGFRRLRRRRVDGGSAAGVFERLSRFGEGHRPDVGGAPLDGVGQLLQGPPVFPIISSADSPHEVPVVLVKQDEDVRKDVGGDAERRKGAFHVDPREGVGEAAPAVLPAGAGCHEAARGAIAFGLPVTASRGRTAVSSDGNCSRAPPAAAAGRGGGGLEDFLQPTVLVGIRPDLPAKASQADAKGAVAFDPSAAMAFCPAAADSSCGQAGKTVCMAHERLLGSLFKKRRCIGHGP